MTGAKENCDVANSIIKDIRPRSTLYRPSFLRPSGGSERVEPDDIAREICRHCAATELRGGNTALPLTSPCYNAIRSSLFVLVAPPSRRPSTPSPPATARVSF